MLRELFSNPIILLYRIPALLLAISVHEAAHGFLAYKLGDPTAKAMGRLTLNPLRHLNPIGTIMLLLFGFGFATPVPVNARYFKKPKRDMALVALAGPLSNILLAVLGLLIFSVCNHTIGWNSIFAVSLNYFLSVFVSLNIGFAVFNLLPVPPLDGSRIVLTFLPSKAYFWVMQYEQYIQITMFVLLFLGFFDGILSWLFGIVLGFLSSIFIF